MLTKNSTTGSVCNTIGRTVADVAEYTADRLISEHYRKKYRRLILSQACEANASKRSKITLPKVSFLED